MPPRPAPGRSRRRLTAVAALGLACAAVACVRTTVTPFAGTARHAPVPAESVVVYRIADSIPAPYDQLAVLGARGDVTTAGEDDIIASLRREAGRLGANGLLVADITSPRGARKVAGILFGGEHAMRRGQAVAIRVRRDSSGAGPG